MARTDFIRIASVILALTAFLAISFGWKYYQDSLQAAASSQSQTPLPVEVVQVATQEWDQSLHTTGSLRAINGVTIASETAGVVDAISFTSGQHVAAGDVIAQLNTDIDSAALETLLAEEKLATQDFKRVSGLVGDKLISQSDFDAATAKLEAARARAHEQRAKLSKKTIRAPFSGRTGLRLIDKGQFLEVGTAIVEIVELNPIYADFTVAERDLPSVKVGNVVEIEVAAFPGESFTGTIEALNASVSAKSRTVQVRAQLPNNNNRLQAGMFAQVRVFSGKALEVLTVPRTSIAYNTYGDYVFTVQKEGANLTVKRQQVNTGEVRNGQAVVTEGLNGNELVIATGLSRLRNGQAVKIKRASAKPASSQAQDQ